MTALAALPDLRAVPAPFWLATALHLLTFVLHLAAMGTLVGSLLTLHARRSPDRWTTPGAKRLVSLFPVLVAATVSLGVAPLLFLQLTYGKVAYSAAIVSAGFWLSVPFSAMAAYGLAYGAARRQARGGAPGALLGLALLALAWVSLVYSSTFSLAERPGAYADLYAASAGGWVLNPDVARWLPRWAQTMALATAIGAFLTRCVSRDDPGLSATALRVHLVAAAAVAVAAGARFALDPDLASSLGPVGLVALVLGATLPLASAALLRRNAALLAGGALALALVGAVIARHVARLSILEGRFDPAAAPVRPQWDVFAIFVVLLAVAGVVIAWMLRTWFRAGRAPSS